MANPLRAFKNHPRLLTGAKWLLSLGLLTAVILWIQPRTILDTIRLLNPIVFIYIGLLFSTAYCLNACELWIMFGKNPIRLRSLVSISFISALFNNFVLGALSGDAIRLFYIGREIKSYSIAVMALVLERMLGFIIQLILALCALVMLSSLPPLFKSPLFLITLGGAGMVLGFIAAVLILSRSGFVIQLLPGIKGKKLDSAPMHHFINAILHSPMRMIGIFSASLAYHCINILCVVLVIRSMGENISYLTAALLLFAGACVNFLPVVMGGIGLTEGVFTVLYNAVYARKAVGLTASLAIRAALVIPSLIGWFLFTRYGISMRKLKEEIKEE
jgi:glycosyltransferase 2 family protein